MRVVLVAASILLVAFSLSCGNFRSLFVPGAAPAGEVPQTQAPSVYRRSQGGPYATALTRQGPGIADRPPADSSAGSSTMAGYLVVGALLGAMATLRHPRAGPAERAAMSSTRTAALALSGRVPHSTDDRIPPEALQLGKAEQWPKLLRQFQSSAAGRNITRHVVACVLSAALAVTPSTAAWADEKRLVGEIPTSGLVFKDTLRVESYTDPKVAGVQLFLGDFSIPATEKFAKGDVFSDPSNASLSCSRKGRVVVSAGASEKLEGEEVIADSKNLFFKSVKVRRLVDKKSGNVVYAAFSQRVDTGGDSNKSRFSNSICAVPVDEFESAQ